MVDNTLSPHGGKIVERVVPSRAVGAERIRGLKAIPVRGQIATECISIAYGFFSPLEGFMLREDVDAVAEDMRLASGYVWSIPIVFDLSLEEISQLRLREGDMLLLTYQGQPLATLAVEEIYACDKERMARMVYGTTDESHPGVRRTYAYKDRFLGGKVTLINPPKINPPFDRFWHTPGELREKLKERGWTRGPSSLKLLRGAGRPSRPSTGATS